MEEYNGEPPLNRRALLTQFQQQQQQQQPNGKLSLFSLCFVLYSNDVPSNTQMKCYSVLIKTLLALQC